VRENASASPVAAWDGAGGPKLVTIDVGPNDVDANGWLWLLMTADPRQTVGMGLGETPQGNWQILRLDATIDAAVTGPPQAPKATWTDPEEEARRAAKAARKPQSKPDAGPTDEPDEVP
jgi:hypothetical protein